MRRLRNLALFAIVSLALLLAVAWSLRGALLGVNFDAGTGGRAELIVPTGYRATVFAEGLDGPRFMAVSPAGTLFVAERGADRVIALPDADADGAADEVVEVGTGYGAAHDIEFRDGGSLLVAGEEALYEVTLDGLVETERRILVDGLPTGGHATKTVELTADDTVLLSVGSSCDTCHEADARRASIQRLSADGLQPVMVGLRNAVGLWVDDKT
ncbi:MAG: PQQ-dependent sugar dehydrogenase, partial [Candidatus Limnocylindria bacterium]